MLVECGIELDNKVIVWHNLGLHGSNPYRKGINMLRPEPTTLKSRDSSIPPRTPLGKWRGRWIEAEPRLSAAEAEGLDEFVRFSLEMNRPCANPGKDIDKLARE